MIKIEICFNNLIHHSRHNNFIHCSTHIYIPTKLTVMTTDKVFLYRPIVMKVNGINVDDMICNNYSFFSKETFSSPEETGNHYNQEEKLCT